MPCRVKICGVTRVEDADLVLQAGAHALGVNLIPSSKRYVEPATARAIVDHVRGKLLTVAVVADPSLEQAQALQRDLSVDYLQLHGDETPELLQRLGGRAFKAVRIGSPSDVVAARAYSGELLLVDAKVPGVLGGSGVAFDWTLVQQLARERSLIVAGGLHAGNVAQAITLLQPWGVDIASGVEEADDPRKKSQQRLAALLTQVRQAVMNQKQA